MKNWEEVYEKYKNGEMEQRYNELRAKFTSQKNRTMEEFNELKKMEKIMNNLPKVENIMDYKEKLDKELETLKAEYSVRMNQDSVNNDTNVAKSEIEENEKAIKEVEEKIDELVVKMNETKDREEIGSLKEQRDEEVKKLGELNSKKLELNNKAEEIQKTKQESNKQLKSYSTEDLRAKCFEVASMMSKCNTVAGLLMEGASRDSISLKLEGWKDRKFTAKTPLPLTIKERANKRAKNESVKEEPVNADSIEAQIDKMLEEQEDKGKALIKPDEFATAFPRLAKRFPNMSKNIFGKALLKAKKMVNKEEITIEEPIVEEPTVENLQQETKQKATNESKKEKFHDYLKYDILDVADKGIDGIQEERREELKKKLEENRRIATEKEI